MANKYLDKGGVSHFWDKVKSYLDNRFGTGTKINSNGFYVEVVGMTARGAEAFYIKNECGLGLAATWGSSMVRLYNESGKGIIGTWSTLSGSVSGNFKMDAGAEQELFATPNSVIFIVWMYDLDL